VKKAFIVISVPLITYPFSEKYEQKVSTMILNELALSRLKSAVLHAELEEFRFYCITASGSILLQFFRHSLRVFARMAQYSNYVMKQNTAHLCMDCVYVVAKKFRATKME
jgi:hypothetical protein